MAVHTYIAEKTVRSREARGVASSRQNGERLKMHLQGSCRYRRSTPCSRPGSATITGRGVSRTASRKNRHSDCSTRGNSDLKPRMPPSSASPPSRKSPHAHPFELHPEATLQNAAACRRFWFSFFSGNSRPRPSFAYTKKLVPFRRKITERCPASPQRRRARKSLKRY